MGGTPHLCSPCAKSTVFAFKFQFFFSLNAESSCFLSKLCFCVCVCVFITHIFTDIVSLGVITFGAFVREEGLEGCRGVSVCVSRLDLLKQQAPPGGPKEAAPSRPCVSVLSDL